MISTPMVSFAFTAAIWDLPASDLGWIALSAAVLYALAAFVLRRLEGSPETSRTLMPSWL